jgi:hypothetical protein
MAQAAHTATQTHPYLRMHTYCAISVACFSNNQIYIYTLNTHMAVVLLMYEGVSAYLLLPSRPPERPRRSARPRRSQSSSCPVCKCAMQSSGAHAVACVTAAAAVNAGLHALVPHIGVDKLATRHPNCAFALLINSQSDLDVLSAIAHVVAFLAAH